MNIRGPLTLTPLLYADKPVAIVDVDGVALDNNHRLHHITHVVDGVLVARPDADWPLFHSLEHFDPPGAACGLIRQLAHEHSIVFVTARADFDDRGVQLEGQLSEISQFAGIPFGLIMQQPITDPEVKHSINHHAEYKRGAIKYLREQGLVPTVGIDDSQTICQMFTEEGLLSLRVYNHIPETALWR